MGVCEIAKIIISVFLLVVILAALVFLVYGMVLEAIDEWNDAHKFHDNGG